MEIFEKLNNLISVYALNKSELDSYKKLCDKENGEIKSIMWENDLTEHDNGEYIAKRTVSYRKSLDEDKLLELLQERGYKSVIKTKEYVDADLLENAIYHNEIDADTLLAIDSCTNKQEVVTLKLIKKKENTNARN